MFTPGPWHIEEINPGEWQINSDSSDVCVTNITSSIDSGCNELSHEDMGNARLIAAAPEMLECLMELLNDLQTNGSLWANNPLYHKGSAAMMKALCGEKK